MIETNMQNKAIAFKRLFSQPGLKLFPSQRRGAPFRALARGEGTNSVRQFTRWERNGLAKSKVHQILRAHGVWVVISSQNMAVCQE
jgi:hypothetical protein